MNERISHIVTGTLAGLATGAALISFEHYAGHRGYSLNPQTTIADRREPSKSPGISHYMGSRIYFNDDLAPGMKAFASYEAHDGKKQIELKPNLISAKFGDYQMPDELRAIKNFQVWAVDRDGNRSQPVAFTTLDGIIVKSEPFRNAQIVLSNFN